MAASKIERPREIIADAEDRGRLTPGSTIVEGTAGNTGIGIATLATERGYRVIVSMPDNQSAEKVRAARGTRSRSSTFQSGPFCQSRSLFIIRPAESRNKGANLSFGPINLKTQRIKRAHYLNDGARDLGANSGGCFNFRLFGGQWRDNRRSEPSPEGEESKNASGPGRSLWVWSV